MDRQTQDDIWDRVIIAAAVAVALLVFYGSVIPQ